MRRSLFKEWRKRRTHVPELGERHMLCNWVRDEQDLVVDMHRYGELLTLLPDKVVSNLEKARLARDGRMPMLKAGLGYEELLSSVIVDGTAVHDSSTENILFPDLLLPANYMQPGGIAGRTLRWRASGRLTTLSTTATLTFNIGSGTTAVTVPTVSWAKSGTITMDSTAQTASQWFNEGLVVTRTVGSSGTVFAQGFSECAAQALTVANNHANFMGSAGQDTPSTASFDMTLAQYVAITAKWSLTTAYSITGHVYVLEALN
jgi:hypothetical protein